MPFADGLPLPRTAFFETRMTPVVAAPSAGAPPPLPAAVPVLVKQASEEGAGVRRKGGRERSVMSIKAAREYDGASIFRRDEDDEESPRSRPRRALPRPSSSLAMESTAPSAASSRGMSRSSSSGNLPASAAPLRPTTPSSQTRFLAYPPLPPVKPESTPAVRVSLRALSISDPLNPFQQGEGQKGGETGDRSPRSVSSRTRAKDSPVSDSSPPEPCGKFGYCSICSKPAGLICEQVMVPVCSYPCKIKCLQAHGLPCDDEKERPPPLNPQAVQSPSRVSAYPSLAASPNARQPGPAGFCVVCHYPATFMCKDTLVPVCSGECKAVNLRLNPHLKGGGGRVVEPSAPSQFGYGGAASSPSPSPRQQSEPRCVVCGDVSDFRCSVTDATVCSRECKDIHIRQSQPQVSQGGSSGGKRVASNACPSCTFHNPPGASACEICSSPLPGGSSSSNEPPSPKSPTYHLHLRELQQQGARVPQRPSVPKRPSFAPVTATAVAVAPGGPQGRVGGGRG